MSYQEGDRVLVSVPLYGQIEGDIERLLDGVAEVKGEDGSRYLRSTSDIILIEPRSDERSPSKQS